MFDTNCMSDTKRIYKEAGGATIDVSDAGINAIKRLPADPDYNRSVNAAAEQVLKASADPQRVAMQEAAVRCAGILSQAGVYYQQPLGDLKYRKPLDQMYAEERSVKPIGVWVENVPTPGNVASCLKPGGGGRNH